MEAAERFAKKMEISRGLQQKLEGLVQTQLDSLLQKIEEEGSATGE